jgi:hypothetical protein
MLLEFIGPSYITDTMRGNIRWAAAELFEVPDDDEKEVVSLSTECDIYSFGSIFFQVSSLYFQTKDDIRLAYALGADLQGTLLQCEAGCCSVGASYQGEETRASQGLSAGACVLGVHTAMLVTPCKSSIGWRNRSVCRT